MLTLPNFFLNIGDPKAMKNFQDTFEHNAEGTIIFFIRVRIQQLLGGKESKIKDHIGE